LAQLNEAMPLHGILARMAALDGIPFLKFRTSLDIRLGIEARLEKLKCSEKLPISESTVRNYVMQYAEKSKDALKKVAVVNTAHFKSQKYTM
jgi:hypothetical protein